MHKGVWTRVSFLQFFSTYLDGVKRKSVFEDVQNVEIQIIQVFALHPHIL